MLQLFYGIIFPAHKSLSRVPFPQEALIRGDAKMKECARCNRLVGKRSVVCMVCRREHSKEIILTKLQKPEVRKHPLFIPIKDIHYFHTEDHI